MSDSNRSALATPIGIGFIATMLTGAFVLVIPLPELLPALAIVLLFLGFIQMYRAIGRADR